MEFHVGDRVLCISPEDDSDVVYQDTGTVWIAREYESEDGDELRVGVEWDNFCQGHALDDDNPCRHRHGWFVYARTLQLITPPMEDVDIDFNGGDIL